jgi:ribosomal protein L7/L12
MKQSNWLADLQAADARVRQQAVLALTQQGQATREGLDGLVGALQDADSQVRVAAVEALSVLGAQGQAAPAVLAGLLATLQDPEFVVRRQATEVLGALGQATPAVVAGLLAALQDDWVGAEAARALVALDQSSPDVLYGLLAALYHGDASVRARAAEALAALSQAIMHRTARSGQLLDPEREEVLLDRLRQADRADKQQWFLEAQHLYGEALTIARERGDRAMEGRILRRLALAKHGLVPFQERVDLHEQAVAIARELGDYVQEQANLAVIAYLYKRLGRFPEEVARHEQAWAMAQAAGDRTTADGHVRTMVYLHRYTGWTKEASALRVLAETIARQSSVPLLQGGIYDYSPRTDGTQADYERELADLRRLHKDPRMVVTLGNTAEVERALHAIEEARTHYEQALTLVREVGDHVAEAALLGEIASCHEQSGRTEAALAHYEQAVTVARAVSDLNRHAAALPGLLPAVRGSKIHAELLVTCVALQAASLDGIAFCTEQTGRSKEPLAFTATLTAVGPNKIQVIKTLRELVAGLGVKGAKVLVDTAPTPIKERVSKAEAEAVRARLAEAGATVEIDWVV